MHQAIAEINSSNKNLYSLHIPRASLNSSSSSGASSISRSREFSPNLLHQKRHGKHTDDICKVEIESEWDEQSNANTFNEEDGKKPSTHQKGSQKYFVHKVRKANLTATQSSSSSSSASNQSNHSVNSLLLSVKNLENFNSRNADNVNSNKIYNTSDNLYRKQMLENIKNILAIDNSESKNHRKKKEPDQISTSSTATNTNFTVITFTGFDKTENKKSRAICRRRHQVTILIICMTFLLFIGISSAVCMLEMRYQKMPR